jgi:histidyl-tRNA synthetase
MASQKKNKIQPLLGPKGMHDVLPEAQAGWDRIRKVASEVAHFYNFERIDTPLMEHIELFERSVGGPTDIVEKQMFTVGTKGKDRLVLRPEATAGIVRAYIEHSLGQRGLPLKLYTEGPMFRYEQPQAGRTRQFYQYDFEIIAADDDSIYDAQAILTGFRFLEGLKIKGLNILINSIGCKNCRPGYRRQLQSYYRPLRSSLCADCARRFETNPLRLLDCKEEKCREIKKEAPVIIDHLCTHCHNHFKATLEYLDELKLPYSLDHHLVRGLDYYSKTVFEFMAEGVGFAIAGGGRYDYLIELMGGKDTPAVGWAGSVERMLEALAIQGVSIAPRAKSKISLIYIGDLPKRRSLAIIEDLRRNHVEVTEAFGKESLKAQLRAADKAESPLALIFGQKEAFEEAIIVRDLKTGVQETVPLVKLADTIKKRLR